MIALTESGTISLVNTCLIVFGTVLVAFVGRWSYQGRKHAEQGRQAIVDTLKPENGYDTIGQGISAIEDRLVHHDERFERLAAQVEETLMLTAETRTIVRRNTRLLDKHLDEWDPLLEWAERQAALDEKED